MGCGSEIENRSSQIGRSEDRRIGEEQRPLNTDNANCVATYFKTGCSNQQAICAALKLQRQQQQQQQQQHDVFKIADRARVGDI
ncbi:GD13776 [Drosophila simulans]|uniref:GD13776 n=1 Tax=Drosophila simulans TaxID=7240 RepID=B4QPK6_DROSI|nr:GD13776 [Drosophila simulans]